MGDLSLGCAAAALACVLFVGCGASRPVRQWQPAPQWPPPQPAAPAAPRFARVQLVGLTVGLGKTDGSPWDPNGRGPNPAEVQAVAAALSLSNPAAAALQIGGLLVGPTAQALSKPDVFGGAALVTGQGVGTPQQLSKVEDSFTPAWAGIAWVHVPLDGSTRIRVKVVDADLDGDDPIGTFEIGPRDIAAAIAQQKVYPVQVADQTSKQVLFASVSAFLE